MHIPGTNGKVLPQMKKNQRPKNHDITKLQSQTKNIILQYYIPLFLKIYQVSLLSFPEFFSTNGGCYNNLISKSLRKKSESCQVLTY